MNFQLEENPQNLLKFIASKGSICLDGVSLTINDVEKNSFSVNIIKHTLDNTAFGAIKINDIVNVEIDLIARYLEKLLQK